VNTKDQSYMKMALGLARRGLGRTWPNPAVGCVVVNGPHVVGRGWTQPGGRPHAETMALAQAGAKAKGATCYVTLEPCAHHGQTPPCVDALIASGVSRVVAAVLDPNPKVAGKGFENLRAAGISVVTDVCAEEARQVNQGFLSLIEQGRPTLTLKLATSFDGRIATASGESQWITGPAARRRVHALRATHDAVLVGAGTARDDDPSLTVRGMGVDHQPVRLIWSRNLDIPLTGHLAQTAKDIPVWMCCGSSVEPGLRAAWEGLGAKVFTVPVAGNGQIDVLQALQVLGEAGLTRIFCEGGGALAASLLQADCVDTLVGYTAGLALGAEGRPSLGALGIDVLATAPRFKLQKMQAVEGDVCHQWVRHP